jgi:hypothetical protein
VPVVNPLIVRVSKAMKEVWNRIVVEICLSIFSLFIKIKDKNIPSAPLRAPHCSRTVCFISMSYPVNYITGKKKINSPYRMTIRNI